MSLRLYTWMAFLLSWVAGGQGVIVIVLNDVQDTVLAICAESLQKLQDWSRIWQVVVGDFTLSGHDQIVLFRGSMNSVANLETFLPLSQNGLDSMSIHGFSNFDSMGTPQGSQQHLKEVKTINDHQLSGLETILMALHERIEAGIAELKLAENEMESNKELYHIATNVMQGTVAVRTLPSLMELNIEQGKTLEQDQMQAIQVTKVQNRIFGMTWLLSVEVEVLQGWSCIIFHDVSLFVTSLNGSISGRSSVLSSLSFKEGSRCLVISIPLQTLSLLPGFPFHVFVKAARISMCNRQLDPEISGPVNGRYKAAYTQWLCCSDVTSPTSLKPLELKEATDLISKVANQQRQFVVAADSKEHILQMADIMRSDLCLHDVFEEKLEKSEGILHLMSLTGAGVVYWKIVCIGTHAILTLKTSNVQLMAMLQQSLISLTHQHQIQLLPGMTQHETLDKVQLLADALVEELELSKYAKESSHHGEYSLFHSKLLKLQMATDIRCTDVLSSLM